MSENEPTVSQSGDNLIPSPLSSGLECEAATATPPPQWVDQEPVAATPQVDDAVPPPLETEGQDATFPTPAVDIDTPPPPPSEPEGESVVSSWILPVPQHVDEAVLPPPEPENQTATPSSSVWADAQQPVRMDVPLLPEGQGGLIPPPLPPQPISIPTAPVVLGADLAHGVSPDEPIDPPIGPILVNALDDAPHN